MKKSEYICDYLEFRNNKTIVGMEKRLLLFISILLTSIGFVFGQNALTDILPKYSKTINGNCFLVGNTNTQLVDLIGKTTDDVTQEIEYEGELGAIKNTPVNTDNISIKNCNFAEFCLTIQTECGETSVEDARISWGGREETPLSSTSTVYVKITDNTGNDLPIEANLAKFQAISGNVIKKTPTKSVQNDGFYVVHQEITDYINAVLKDPGFPKTGTYRIYVANVPVKLKRSDPSEDAGQFCGWNFSLVYRHPLLPRRSIMVYNTDLFQESTSSGNTPDPIFSSFKFGNANPFKTNDTISFVFCNFGGMLLQTTDCFRLNKEGDLLSIMPNDKKYYGKGGKLQFQDQAITNNGSTVDDNPFRCMINYLYENKDCSIKQYNPYSRGFDLTKTTLAPVSQNTYNYIQQNDSAFNLTIVPTQEYHLFTNALLYIGAPDAPEAALPMEVSKTDIMPDDTFKCVLYVKTGENKNGLTNINVRIPISEYIASIDSFNIEFHSLVKSTNNGTNSANSYPTISTVKDAIVSDKPSTTKVRDWNQTNNNKFMKEALTFVNDYLEEVDKINDNYATTKPSVLKTREIIFSFPNLIVPNKVTDEDAITITLILHSKSEDDPIYNKQTYMGGTPQVIPQAQLDLTDNVTRDTSIFESSYEKDIDWEKYKCEINGDGGDGSSSDDGGSDCTGLNGGTKTGSGIYKKNNTNLVEVNILANGDCRETPDSINIHFCDELYIAAIDIKRQLAKMDFDIDSIAKVDSCLWESHKRDSLVGFAGKHGVNRALLEELLSNNDKPIELIDTTKAWDNFFNGCQPKLDADDVESIVNMETEFSDIYVLFNEDTQDTIPANVFQKSNFISLRDENSLSEVFHITNSEKLFIYYKSPWNNKGASCDKYIPIYFIKKEMKDPIIICNNDTIHKNDTIYACLGNELQNIKIHKNFPEYNVYAAIKDTIGGSEQIVFDKIINNTFDTIATWEIQKTGGIDTNIPGTRRISIWEKDLAESCKGDSFSFFIKVLDLKIDETPDLLSGNTETEFCRSFNSEDSLTLRATKDASHQEYKVLWYRVDKDVDEIIRVKLGEGDTINIPIDTVFTDPYLTIRYEATYFKDHCESNPTPIDILLNNSADSIATDTMVICQHYRLSQNDVFTQLNDWNPGKSYSANNVKFYPYYDVALGDIEENMKQALKKDSMSFEHLMDNLDTQTGCATDGTRHTHFIVQGVTDKGCGGVPSLVTVKINCRTKDAPVFGGGVDSIRYCTGDSPITDFDEFLDEPGDYSGGYKWVWKSLADAASLPVDKYRSTAYGNVTTGGNPMTNTAIAGEESYVVVRIDSNSCVSDVDTFRIVVADAITSYAMIGDTTKVINVTEKEFSLNFCEGANPYSSKTLPAVGYPSRDYILEWYKKDNQNDDCDTLEKYNKNRLEYTIDIDYSNTDTIFYAMRQSTDQGCKGPWLNVGIYIHPNVDSVPLIDTVEMCEGEFPKGFNIHKTTDTDLMLYLYASDKTTEVLESEMKVDTTADRYLFSAGKSLYYAQYKNKNTQCYGPMVGTNAIVNPKPHLPQMNEDTTVYLCAVDDTVNLTAKIEATINNLDLNTRIGWTPKDHVITKEESNAKYYVFQEDSITKCVGESIEINVKVENTIKYHPFGIKNLCYGESISLQDTINKLLSSKNDIILQKDQKVNIYQLINNVKGSKVTQSIQSQKTKDQNDTTKYLIEIEDIISGCRVTDTATVIFNGLPNASVDNQISACQDVVFTLPTPKDNTYNYTWKRETGDKVNGNPAQLVLQRNETVRLVEVNPSTGCVDSFDVDITIYPTPAHALTRDTAFCQNTTNKKIDVTIQTTADGFNDDKNDFNLQWFNAQMDSVSNPIITDDLTLNGISNAFQYTVRQRNTITQCYKDTTITVKIRKTPELGELTIDPVCEPATISLYQEAIDHVSKNIVKNNFENTSSLRFSFGQIINLQSHPLTEAEAQEIHYTAGSDSVIYTYTVEDDVCSASDTLYITINKKPNTPIIEEGKDTVWFCKDDAPIYLSARNMNDEADTQNPTQIHWGDYTTSTTGDSILITKSASDYYAFSQNERTGCVSDLDTIHAVISFPVEFAKTGTLHFCFRDSFDLYQDVEKKVLLNTKNSKSDLRFNIYKMSGNVPDFNNPIKGKVASNKSIHETDTTNYFIEIIDHVSGCQFLDTATMIFHGLPVIESIPDIEICQYQDTALPTPNKGYDYSWYRSADNRLINDPTHYNTGEKEHIYLKAVEQFPLNNLTCYDSLMVYMDVKKIPVAATVQSDTFCQLSGEHLIPVTLNESDDNPKKDLSILWFNEKGDTVSTPINTDEVVMTGNSTTIKYTIRQRNVTNGCFHDTIVPFVVNRAIKLQMEDLPAVCQPDSIDFRTNVLNYLTSSTTTNISNVSNYDITYSKIVNKQESALTDEEASNIQYTAGVDSMLYAYNITDGICSASDSVYITINKKPSTPIIEEGKDTVWFCSANGQLHLTAKQDNDTQKTKIFWGDYTSTQQGDTFLIPNTPPVAQYTAFAKDILSGCVSGFDTIIAEIKEAIKVNPIADNGKMEKCEGETVNVYDLAMASFVIDSTPHTKIRFIATENGFSIGENELKNVSKTQQDTLRYIFTVEDEMTQCDATNELTLIFHKNPVFDIAGKTTLCEGDTVNLSAIGDERPVTYAWGFEGGNVMSTSADFSIKNIRQDTTIYLIESLKGTTCSDTLTQHLTVNVAPAPLPDTAFSLCQDTAAKENRTVNIGRSNSNIQGYSIKWYNQNSEMISEKEFVEVSTTQTASYSYQIETIDKKTNCVSQRNHVVITVNPQITIGLDKVDTICQPFTYALKTNAISSVSGGTNPIYDRTESNGTLVANDDSISESGLYTLYFTDDNQCEANKTLSIQFYEQPGTPQLIGDTILCQGTGIAQFTAKKTGANSMNQTFEWKSQAEETLADTLNFNTQNYGITPYTLQAVDQKSNCRSEALSFTVDVRESIQYSPIELLEGCFGTTIDLAEKAEKSYSGNDEEKKLSYYYLSENQNLTSVTAPEAISKSGQYVIKANEEISGCERQDTVEIIIYDSIGVSTEGSKEICQGEEVEGLIAINADRYTWIRGNGNSEETASFPFASSVTESEKFRLIGEKKIGSLFCQDSLDIQITVHTNPATLPDTTLYFCQDTTGGDKEIILEKIIGDGEKLALTWTDEAGDTLFIGEEEATTSIKEYGTVVYHVTQVNTDTKCSSKQADVTITTLPQIRVRLKDTTTCVPNNINLVSLAEKAAHAEGFDDDITVSAYEIINNGRATDVTDIADSITSGGTYRITYQYESNGAICQSEGISQLTFNTQPSKPSVADQNFCQNTGEYELKGKVNANNVRLLWEDLSVYPPKADTNTTTISTDIATRKLYLVRQVQDLSGCVSEADSSWMTVYPAIESMDKDTAICYGETVNLYDFTNGSYIGGTPKHSVTFKNAEGITFDAEKVNKSGTYFAYYSDSMNICHDTASLVINVDDPMEITVAGGGAACTDQTIVLEATGAENYEWSNGKKEPSITVISEEAQTMTFSVEGRRIFKDIYCKADTNVTIVFNNAVKPRELTFDTCARNNVTIDDIILKNNVTETVDTIWNKTDNVRFANIFQNLGKTGTYELAVHNEEGCTTHHILNVKMHSVENLKVDHQEGTYCYGSLANFKVSGENAREFEWTNLTDGTITTGEIYNEAITETTDFRLIATEKELGCKDTVDFTIEAYPNKEITITGNVTSCRDSLIVLSAESVLTDVRWDFEDSIVSGRDIRFIADNDRKIILKGTDENGCPAEKPVNISVAYLEDPIIEFDLIEDSEYALSDDVKEIELREKYTPSGSNLYKFTWNFGDGKMEVDSSSNSIFHTYNDTIIHSRRDINVNLLVEHQYGCKKSASAILKIDPFIFVPNTMIADGEYIFMEDYDLQIFDRVGTLIYQGKGWDGSYKGEPASEDTYFYSLTYFEKGEKKFKTGYITLVR